jgi:7,8-dihydropterin-6-yl-methyl-4-(beta-D-ribofuranosyl)aminobenzene 5'-phosphate synthase
MNDHKENKTMKIITLVENTSISDAYETEHGLSIYIETKAHKLLFDLGASHFFAENAAKMGIDLTAVDTAVISHGHRDHGGGLKKFMDLNSRADIYVNKSAFEKHFNKKQGGRKERSDSMSI